MGYILKFKTFGFEWDHANGTQYVLIDQFSFSKPFQTGAYKNDKKNEMHNAYRPIQLEHISIEHNESERFIHSRISPFQ